MWNKHKQNKQKNNKHFIRTPYVIKPKIASTVTNCDTMPTEQI